MKILIRTFFKLIRALLGPVMIALEWVATLGGGPKRTESEQQAIDARCQRLSLYTFRTCPFCVKVRIKARKLGLDIKQFDAQHDAAARKELEEQGGMVMVPCLRIVQADGQVDWMYESDRIIEYFETSVVKG